VTTEKYVQLEAEANERVAELEQLLDKLNTELNEKNHELERIALEKGEHGEEYILHLESELVRLDDPAYKSNLGEQLKLIQKENQVKDE
jgi:hypothetical protein